MSAEPEGRLKESKGVSRRLGLALHEHGPSAQHAVIPAVLHGFPRFGILVLVLRIAQLSGTEFASCLGLPP